MLFTVSLAAADERESRRAQIGIETQNEVRALKPSEQKKCQQRVHVTAVPPKQTLTAKVSALRSQNLTTRRVNTFPHTPLRKWLKQRIFHAVRYAKTFVISGFWKSESGGTNVALFTDPT